jgi:hypothetical protein
MSVISFYWHILVNQIGRLGLPIDKYLLTYALVALLVYCLGYVSKTIAGADD